jgi:outer membrane protein assembly factor BamB
MFGMSRNRRAIGVLLFVCGAAAALGADWRQFRGPHGLGVSPETGLPFEWSARKNIVWRTKLPGPGASSPVTVGDRVFVTSYSGYGLDAKNPGTMDNLRRHLICVDKRNGSVIWSKEFQPAMPLRAGLLVTAGTGAAASRGPVWGVAMVDNVLKSLPLEHKYAGEGSYHGYAASTPASDGERLYVFFGKMGVYCFDLDGNEIWHVRVGKNTNGWGSGASPLLYKNLVIINASVESGMMYGLDKLTGKEVWKAKGIGSAWNTPVLVPMGQGEPELVISIQSRLRSFHPDTGTEIWNADGVHRYVCPSVIAHDGVVYAIGGGHTSLAVKAGGTGDVTKSHTLWYIKKGSNVASPIYYEGHLYWAGDGGIVYCQNAANGDIVYQERLDPPAGNIWASPILADGKLYYVSQKSGTYVVAAAPKFKQLAHNVFDDDKSRTNASIAVSDGQLLLRTDQYLYCIGKR